MAKFSLTDDSVQALRKAFIELRPLTGFIDSAWPDDLGAQFGGLLQLANNVLYVDPVNGNDLNSGSSTFPIASWDTALYMLNSEYHQFTQINLVAGNYTWTNKNIFLGKAVGNQATPVAIVGALSNELGACTVTGGSTTSTINFTPTTAIRTGSVASIVAGAAAGNVRITGLTDMVPTDVDRVLLISGASSAANNGPFTIAQYNSATSVDVVNAQAVTGDSNNGAITWQETFEGCYLQFASNTTTTALQNQARQIRTQTSTTEATTATVFGTGPSAGDTFTIQRPASVIQYGVSQDAASAAYVLDSGTIGLQAVKFKRVAGSAGLTFRLAQSQLESVHFQNGVLLVTNYSVLPAGQSSAVAQWSNQSTLSPFQSTRTGCGAFLQDVSTGVMLTNHCRIVGTWVGLNTNIVVSQDAFLGPTLWGDRISVTLTGGEMSCSAGGISKQQTVSATTGIVTGQMGAFVTLTGFDISNSGGYGVDLQNGSQGRFGSLTGTGNTATGGRVDRRSGATIDSPSGSTTITGTAGDWTFGRTTVPDIETYATIRTAASGTKGYQDAFGNRVDA